MAYYGFNTVPADYEYINVYNSFRSPSTVHTHNTALAFYFRKYLLTKVFSVFDFDLPDTWNAAFFKYVLFGFGYVAVLNTDKFGIIPQNCTLSGMGIYYQPTHAIVANPLLKGAKRLQIGTQTEIIKCQPNYSGIMDIISYYGDMMAVTAEALGVNTFNTRLAYVFMAKDKTQAESFKKMYDQLASGEPAVFMDKKLFNDDGSPTWMQFNQDVKNTFVGLELIEALEKIDNRFDTLVGIPNANYEKKERLLTDEVNANNFDTKALALQWYEEIRSGMDKVNRMFNLDLSVKLRNENEVKTDAYNVDRGLIQV